MPRSTKADKARQLNVAQHLLKRNVALSEAASTLSREFGRSLRQAYRYLEEAAQLKKPVPITEATAPVTLKLPPTTVQGLRAYARSSGQSKRRARRDSLEVHLAYAFNRLFEWKLAQAYDMFGARVRAPDRRACQGEERT